MARVLIVCVALAVVLSISGCGTSARPGLALIEPTYSHMRDPQAASPGAAPVAVTAGAESTSLASVPE